ncbi:hypothetical protein H9W95_04010 [Flavobacterium lindanitolerans]|nr:hypothetical protein [Flavobacterium lindanitolerans]
MSQSGCTRQSNTISLTIGQISIASTSPATDILLPGETKTFTVTTDAAAPQFAWFRNNDPIPGSQPEQLYGYTKRHLQGHGYTDARL